MADSVQYVMDRMASHFRQLVELDVFSQEEVRSIVKKRTEFEYILKRRQMSPEDFYGYLQYEVNLDKLRSIRCDKVEKLAVANKDKQDGLRNIKSFSSRHICSVFDRAVRRFPNNMELWTDYIAFLKENKSNSILNTVFGKALSLHPKNEDFWMQAAVHELDVSNNVHAARTLFQRGLRVNKHCKRLWLRYFELELWNAARTSERARILGVEPKDDNNLSETAYQGAPLVVFKHALLANSDIDLACNMHACASELVDSNLASVLEVQLREKFSDKTTLWSYFARRISQVSPTATTKKRKGNQGSGHDEEKNMSVVEAWLGKLDKVLDILSEGRIAISGAKSEEQETFRLMELEVLSINMQSLQLAVKEWKSGVGSDDVAPTAAAATSNTAGKKRRTSTASSLASLSSSSTGKTMDPACVALLKATAKRLFDVIRGGTSVSLDKHLAEAKISAIPQFIGLCCARYQLGCFVSVLAPQVMVISQHESEQVFDLGTLAEWLFLTAQRVERSKSLRAIVGSPSWEQGLAAAKYWSKALQLCNSAFEAERSSRTNLQVHKDKESPVSDEALILSVAKAGVAGISLAVCCEEGCIALGDTLETLGLSEGEGVNDIDIKEKYWKPIISCSHLQPLSRGDWCARFVQYALSRADSADDKTFRLVREAYDWVEAVLKTSPPAVIGGDLTEFYAAVIEFQQSQVIFAAEKKGPKIKPSAAEAAFARQVMERATQCCPSKKRFWDAWEQLERQLGNHEVANHLVWKRGTQTF